VHLANKKAHWYRFKAAFDLPEMAATKVPRRNSKVVGKDRDELVIDSGLQRLSRAAGFQKVKLMARTTKFRSGELLLGEIWEEEGRLVVLGGHGRSESPSGSKIFDHNDPDSFGNA